MKKTIFLLLLIPFAAQSQIIADTVYAVNSPGDTIKYVTYRNTTTTAFIPKVDTGAVVATKWKLDSTAAALATYTQSRINDTAAAIRVTVNGKANLASPTFTGTVSGVTAAMVGLGNVDNTSDAANNSAIAALTNKIINNQSLLNNFSTTNQTVNAATTALLTGSLISVPVGKLQIGTQFIYRISISKTAAGTAANTFLFKIGVNGTTADATVLTFTTGLGTAVVDNGMIDIIITIRGPLSASCIAQGNFRLVHNLASTGLLTVAGNSINVTSGVFDATTANLKVSISCTTAASTVLTFQQVIVQVLNI